MQQQPPLESPVLWIGELLRKEDTFVVDTNELSPETSRGTVSPKIPRKTSADRAQDCETEISMITGTDIVQTLAEYDNLPLLNVTAILLQSRGDQLMLGKMSNKRNYPKRTAAVNLLYWWRHPLSLEAA